MFLRANKLWEAVLIPFVLLGIFWSFLGKFLDGQHSVATFLDNTHFILPLFVHISKSFDSGQFPYWINSIVGGIPLYNNPQFSLLYPFYFLGWNLYTNPLDTLLHVHYLTLFHVAVLWGSTYVMMRILHLRVISSVLGATLFAFSANTYQYLFWINIISPYSWLPLALGSVFLILEDEYPKAGLLLGWISIYLLVSASPAQPLIHFVFCAGFFAASHVVIHRADKAKLIAPLRNLVLLAVGGILLSSAILIPTVLFSRRDMERWTDAGPIIGDQKVPFAGFLTGQARPVELAKVLFPLDLSFVTGDPYLGILPIFLASFSLFSRKRSWVVVPLFLLGVYALLSLTGTHLGLAYINYRLPLWNKIREPGRHLYVFALAFCTLAAFGFEHLLQPGRLRNVRKHALVFASFSLLLLVSYWIRQRYQSQISDFTMLSSFALFVVVVCASRFLVRFNHLAHAVAAAIVIYPALYYPATILKIQEGDYFNEDNLHSHRVLQQLAAIEDIGKYRLIVSDKQFSTQYWSMNAAYYGLRTFEAFMNPLPFGQAREMLAAPTLPRYAQLLGGKYYLACGSETPAPANYSFDRNIEGCNLYSSADAQPYYFLSTEIGLAYKNVQEFFDSVGRSDSDLNKLSISTKNADEMVNWLGRTSTPLRWEALREERSRNVFDVVLRTNRRAVLVLNEYLRNEWQVTLDGKTQAPLKVNLNQVGLLLPEGTHEVRFEYRPRLFIWLVYLQRVCFCLLFAGAVITAVKAVWRREKVAVEGLAAGSII
jgi:hypothetical protein